MYFFVCDMEKSVDLVPALVTFLAAAHVIALVKLFILLSLSLYFEKLRFYTDRDLVFSQVYWIYRLASDRQPPKQKPQ